MSIRVYKYNSNYILSYGGVWVYARIQVLGVKDHLHTDIHHTFYDGLIRSGVASGVVTVCKTYAIHFSFIRH